MLRSKEMRRLAAALLAMTAMLTAIGFLIAMAAGLLMLCAALLFVGVFVLYLRRQNGQIRGMCEEIDRVLHNAEHICISEAEEGELAILQSEIVKMTQRIREQNNTLQCEKAYLADSLADVAHQLRTPLTSVNMVLSFVETSEDAQERKTLLREADELLSRMDSLLTALLKLSRLDAGVIELKSERIGVADWVNRAWMPLQIPMELHEVQVTQRIPPDAAVTGDIVWLTEALQNILKNCMESAAGGGRIEIACEDNPLYTRITVRDSGRGFRAEDIPHLFERFYRGKNTAAAGFGIGLALSHTIIARHEGLLTAENHPDGGAMFVIRFYK